MLFIFAILYYVIGVVALAGAFLTFGTGAAQSQLAAGTVGSVALAFWAVALVMGGAMMHAMSAGCVALRDIARNSFR